MTEKAGLSTRAGRLERRAILLLGPMHRGCQRACRTVDHRDHAASAAIAAGAATTASRADYCREAG